MKTISEESFHSSSVASDGSGKKKKGLKKLGSSLKNVFGGKKRRRRRKQSQGGDDQSYSSYDHSDTGDSAIYSYQEVGSVSSRDSTQQDLWLNGQQQQQQQQNNVGGRGMSLSKITEHENEDNSSVEAEASRSRRNPNRYYPSRSNGSSSTPRKASGRRSRKNQAVPPDPLSLVVLLIDPTSLRFELLSLDFDLEGSTTLKRQADAVPELTLTVQDVLDQIKPDSITDEKLREAFASNQCQGLIDRAGKVHFGSANLEVACASRPLRPIDKALEMRSRALARKDDDASRRNSPKREYLLAIPTYGGDPHRDILLGFCGSKSSETTSEVNKTLELSKPIFADANVVGLLEQNGYDLSGWKPGTSVPNREDDQDIRAKRLAQTKTSSSARALLLPQQPSKRRRKFNTDHPLLKMVLAIVAVALATILALVIVSGSLNLIPAVDGESSLSSSWETPQTFEGYLKMGFESVWNWYFVTENAITER